LISGTKTTKQFTATPSFECGSSSIEYQVSYTPASNTPNLISLPTSTVASIEFAQSSNTADAQQYSISVIALHYVSPNWLTVGIATATYTYVDVCAISSLTFTATIENMVTFSGYTAKSLITYNFVDSVSLSNILVPDNCGEKVLDLELNGTTTTYISASSSEYIYFSPPANTTDFGIG